VSCPRREELYRHPWPGQTPDEVQALRDHARDCEECASTVERLGSARITLLAEATTFDRARRAAVWERIESSTEKPTLWRRLTAGSDGPASPWLYAAVAATAVAAVLAFALRPGPRAGVQRAERAVAERATGFAVDPAPGAQFEMITLDLLALSRGRVDVTVEATRSTPLAIRTDHARIEVLAAELSIEVDTHTTVGVKHGRVRLAPADGAPLTLEPGDHWTSAPMDTAGELERAWDIVEREPPTARRIARAVLARDISGAEQVDALAVIADAHRRSGQHAKAADYYGRVAAHPSGRGYAEEALLRRARQLLEIGRPTDAIIALEEAESRFPDGALAPEIRTAKKRAVEMKSGTDNGYP
jgi:tetratricopeptide (TPR) repeat protein